ncbi:hypothetical protein DSM112329_01411 [Paraconexibacter sp. AEG42_29]|uniref:DoxX family protein n=1 Tax=Paraconexibacter sp. AEG42_29 TaxID=2997339 RepID=A0AAU7ASF4_9ACTN
MDLARLSRLALVSYGVMQLAQGLWMTIAPGSFFDALGPFGARNDHYIRDMATWSLAIGPVCLLAARGDAGVRAVVLLLAGLEAAIHTVNHIADADIADPLWVGVFDAVALGSLAVALLVLSRLTTKAEEATTP